MEIHSNIQSDLIRHEEFEGRDHLVIPIVALIEGVLTSGNVGEPQLALASEFGNFPEGWNGRPVVVDHPVMNGESVSANHPTILESSAIGQLFNTRLDGKKLITEAWIDLAKVDEIGGIVKETIDRFENGEMVEVSTGLFADTKDSDGTFEGQHFNGIWSNVVPDHLAILSSGKGACSLEDGCGAPRIHCEGCNGECEMEEPKKIEEVGIRSFLQRFFSNKPQSELSDDDIRSALNSAIASESDSGFIGPIFSDRFIFTDWFTGKSISREFSISDDGTITLSDHGEEVRPEIEFVPVKVNEEEEMEKTVIVTGLIENKATKFAEDDREWLLTLDDGKLEKLAPDLETPSGEGETRSAEEILKEQEALRANAAPEIPTTVEGYVDAAPGKMKDILSHGIRLHDEQRATITAGILANEDNPYTEEELKSMDFVSLEKLAKLAKVQDYSARGGPRQFTSTERNDVPVAPLTFEKKTA